jgi:hypothetical protein
LTFYLPAQVTDNQFLTTWFAPQGWSLPLGVNLAPRGELCPLGGMFTPSITPAAANALNCFM